MTRLSHEFCGTGYALNGVRYGLSSTIVYGSNAASAAAAQKANVQKGRDRVFALPCGGGSCFRVFDRRRPSGTRDYYTRVRTSRSLITPAGVERESGAVWSNLLHRSNRISAGVCVCVRRHRVFTVPRGQTGLLLVLPGRPAAASKGRSR